MSCCLGNGKEPPFSLRPDRATAPRDYPAALTGWLHSGGRANANMSFMNAEMVLRCEQHFHPGRIRVGGLGPFEWSGC